MAIKISNDTVIYDDKVFKVGSGTTAARPASPATDMFRYNTSLGAYERYTGSAWAPVSGDIQYFSYAPGAPWTKLDGSIGLQSAYPRLYAATGKIVDGLNSWTYITSTNTSIGSPIIKQPMIYGGPGGGGEKYVLTNATYSNGQTTALYFFTSTDLVTYVTSTKASAKGYVQSLAYGNSVFLASTVLGEIYSSTDAVTWGNSKTNPYSTSTLLDAAQNGSSLLVVGGVSSNLLTTTNGTTWNIRSTAGAVDIYALAYGAGNTNPWVYAGASGVLATSTDAITWTARTTGTSTDIRTLTYGNGRYVFSSGWTSGSFYNNRAGSSTDGVTWTLNPVSTTTMTVVGISYSSTLGVFKHFAYAGYTNSWTSYTGTSTDGITWSAATSISTGSAKVVYGEFVNGNEFHVRLNSDSYPNYEIQLYKNGTIVHNLVASNLYNVATTIGVSTIYTVKVIHDGSKYVYSFGASPSWVYTSTTGDSGTWTAVVTASNDQGPRGKFLNYFNSKFYYSPIYSSGGSVYTTTDFISSSNTIPETGAISLAYGAGIFVHAQNNNVYTSTNGAAWTLRTSGTTSQITNVTYANDKFIYCGFGGALGTSTDGITWTARTSGTTSIISAVNYNGSSYAYSLGSVNTTSVGTSTDGLTWSCVASTGLTVSTTGVSLYQLTGTQGAFFGIGGSTGLVYSTDGVDWKTAPQITTPSGTASVSYVAIANNLLYANVGFSSPLYSYKTSPYTYNTATEFKLPTVLPLGTSLNAYYKE